MRNPGGPAPAPDDATAELPAAEPAAAGPAAAEPAAPRRLTLSSTVSGNPSGAFLALFAWPLTFNLLRGGPRQMWGWVAAKFINQPYGQAAAGAGPAAGDVRGNPAPVTVRPDRHGQCPPGYDRQSDGTCRLHSRLPL